MAYVVYVNGTAKYGADTFEDAKRHAATHLQTGDQLRIESWVAPAPSQVWIFDKSIEAWVEQVRGRA